MKVIVNNKLIIRNAPEEVVKWCHENFILRNPDYFKKQQMRKWVGDTPQYIFLYEKHGDDLYLPFGCLQEFHKMFGKSAEYRPLFHPFRTASYQSNIHPYDYQQKAVESALKAKNGILVMPCGSGKTQTALEIISRLGGRVLWLTHTQDLLRQSMDRAKSVLDTDTTYGTITSGKIDIGTGITFATVQTLCKVNLSDYQNAWDVIIVDECQHCCGSPTRVTQFYKVISSLCARYKIGLTATPKRADGLERSMFALLGDVIHEVTKTEVADTTCPIKVEFMNTDYVPDYNNILMSDGTLDYTKLVDDLIHDQDRFKFVLETIEKLPVNSPTMVLANRVEYLENLNKAYFGRSVCLSGMGTSKHAKEERKKALKALNDGDIDCLFATYQLAKEGLDVPNLRYVVFATPEKNEVTVIQSAGRVGRKADGKKYGTVIDFVDDFGMYYGWQKKRQKYYKKINAIY